MSSILCTLPLPDPFGPMVAGHAEVRVLGRIPTTRDLVDQLTHQPAEVLCPQLRDRVDAAVLEAGRPVLRAVAVYAVGHDNVDVEAARRCGVAVGNTPGVLTDATADCALGLLLAATRRLVEGDRLMRTGSFTGWEPTHMLGLELSGALLGVVGFGRIGQAVARRALGFGMRIGYTAREARPPAITGDLRGRVHPMPLDRLLAEADVISLHVPLTAQTHHLIDEGALRAMKPTAVLVNTSRGAVVDEVALVRALRERWIGAAALDVYEHEPATAPGLRECANAVLTPHLGSATVATRAAMARLTAENALAALQGRPLPYAVTPIAA